MGIYIVFRVVENVHPDVFVDVNRLRIDEVVKVFPDGHKFSPRELTNPGWRIVYAENLNMEDGEALVLPEVETDPQNPNPVLMRRGWRLNRSAPGITQSFLDYMNDATRDVYIYSTSLDRSSLMSMRQQKPTRRDEVVL